MAQDYQESSSEKELVCHWDELPDKVKEFAGDKLDISFTEEAEFAVRKSGLVEFSYSPKITFGKVTVSEWISGEIEPTDKRIVLTHKTEQMAGVLDAEDPNEPAGLISIPETHSWGIVYREGGRDSSIFIVAKDWQLSVSVDGNGRVSLPAEKQRQMEEHFGSSLGLYNQQKLNLPSTVRAISKPLTTEDVIGVYNTVPTLETGLPIPQIPVVLASM